jgi:RNA polymerase sigma-70 factor (ECF subfamily)
MEADILEEVSNFAPSKTAPPAAVESDLYAAIIANVPGWQQRAFDEFNQVVQRLLIRSLGPNAEIGDLIGDVFLTFFENAHRIRLAGGVRSYLVSITMNIVRREVRRSRRRRLIYGSESTNGEIDVKAGSDDPSAKAALIQLSRILDELNAEERAAFVLHGMEGMQIAEIAQALGMSHSTAKRRVRRANEHVFKRVSRNALLADYIREKAGRRS